MTEHPAAALLEDLLQHRVTRIHRVPLNTDGDCFQVE